MSYHIEAWWEDGMSKLQIIDADSGCVRLAWEYRRLEAGSPNQALHAERAAVQQLFRELFLLSVLKKPMNDSSCHAPEPVKRINA